MIILGIDPGSAVTGYGLVERQAPNRLIHIHNGIISTKAKSSFPARLMTIHQALRDVIAAYRPEEVALEDIFYAKNVKSALKLGHVRGVIMLTAMQQGLPVAEYTPTQVKQAVAGYGRADKTQVQRMVTTLLKLERQPPADAADALAVAICHNFSRNGI